MILAHTTRRTPGAERASDTARLAARAVRLPLRLTTPPLLLTEMLVLDSRSSCLKAFSMARVISLSLACAMRSSSSRAPVRLTTF